MILDYYSPAYLDPLVSEIQGMYWTDNNNTKEHRTKTNQAIACFINQTTKEVAFGRDTFSITLDMVAYSKPLIYNGTTVKRKVGYRPMKRVIDWFHDSGMVERTIGGVDEWGYVEGKFVAKKVTQSRVRLGTYLIEKVKPYADKRKLPTSHSVIEVRDKDGKVIPKRLDPYNKAMVQLYTKYNERLRQSSISVKGLEIDFQIKKIYNNSSLGLGGRLYGYNDPLIYSDFLRRDNRGEILLDGKETVELDFKYLHIALLCERDGIVLEPNFDPYQIELDGYTEKGARWMGKKASLILINAGVGDKGMGGLGKAIKDDSRTAQLRQNGDIPSGVIKRKEVFDAVLARNPYLKKYADNPMGLELQNWDSQIMDAIILEIQIIDEVVIPVHDSLVVKKEIRDFTSDKMQKAYLAVMGSDHNCRIEEK